MKRMHKRVSRRGVTVVEAVVAMTIIAIVSLSALSVISSSRTIAASDAAYEQARYRAEAALECFKFADDPTEFKNALGVLWPNQDDGSSTEYTYTTSVVTLTVTVDYPPDDSDDKRPIFEAACKDKNGKELFRIKYKKGTKGGTADENGSPS